MSKKCSKCEKTVYPAEELKCLDKVWHKGCFKCWECGMTLNMKNYKGYNKFPYCSAHYPQTKATVVADTPEQRRLAQNSQMQSQVVYHADFEKNIKGTMTSLPEDAENKRVKDLANVVSQAAYARTSTSDSYEESYSPREHQPQLQQQRSYVPPQNPHGPSTRMVMPSQAPPPQIPAQPPQPSAPSGPVYVAMYDYDAQDDDEVSFLENDRIIGTEQIDEGWIIGTIQRTNVRGMIPANYVERV